MLIFLSIKTNTLQLGFNFDMNEIFESAALVDELVIMKINVIEMINLSFMVWKFIELICRKDLGLILLKILISLW